MCRRHFWCWTRRSKIFPKYRKFPIIKELSLSPAYILLRVNPRRLFFVSLTVSAWYRVLVQGVLLLDHFRFVSWFESFPIWHFLRFYWLLSLPFLAEHIPKPTYNWYAYATLTNLWLIFIVIGSFSSWWSSRLDRFFWTNFSLLLSTHFPIQLDLKSRVLD